VAVRSPESWGRRMQRHWHDDTSYYGPQAGRGVRHRAAAIIHWLTNYKNSQFCLFTFNRQPRPKSLCCAFSAGYDTYLSRCHSPPCAGRTSEQPARRNSAAARMWIHRIQPVDPGGMWHACGSHGPMWFSVGHVSNARSSRRIQPI
jgi:hypothetical protein